MKMTQETRGLCGAGSSYRRGLLIGLFAAVLTLIGDLLLGAVSLNGAEASRYRLLEYALRIPESRILAGGLLGVVGIAAECIGFYQVYLLIRRKSPRLSTLFRAGMLCYLAWGCCGVHLNCSVLMFLFKRISALNEEAALVIASDFQYHFLLPVYLLFMLGFMLMNLSQFIAFFQRKTPYPRYAAFFNIFIGILCSSLFVLLPGSSAFENGMLTSEISIGNLWMFLMLLLFCPKGSEEREESVR